MTGSSLLPVTWHKNTLYFLFGKENDLEKSAKGFSDFGGGVEEGETILDTAIREGGEELTGFLGDFHNLDNKKILSLYEPSVDYHVHLFFVKYDPMLPIYYNQNHEFLWKRMNHKILSKSKLFEKIKIEWFNINSISRRIKEFRPFYRNVLRMILSRQTEICLFLRHKQSRRKYLKTRKTVKKIRHI